MNRFVACLFLATVSAAGSSAGKTASADTFVLVGGGRLEGQLLNAEEAPRERYIIETPTGGRVVLAADQVQAVESLPPKKQEYLALLPRMPNTAEGLWAMAEWCREAGLNAEREGHLEALLALDPDHKPARLALGYIKADGKWVRPEDRMRNLGYVRFEGAWRLAQEVEIKQRKDRIAQAENQWRRDLRNLRSQIGKRRGPEALAQLQAVRDPFAAPALVELLKEETLAEMAVVFVNVLGQLNHPAASAALTRHALENSEERVRDLCLDHLARRGDAGAVDAFIGALGHKDNAMVNRAAVALARMKDRRAIVPLIDALTTKHKQVIPPSGPPGGIGASFSPTGGGGLAMGGKPKIVEQEIQNPAVLQALTALTGAHHAYSKEAWKSWYVKENTPPSIDLRREP